METMGTASSLLDLSGGRQLTIDQGTDLVALLDHGGADGLMIESWWGFNDLGGFGSTIAKLLGIPVHRLRELSEKFKDSEEITLLALTTVREESALKTVVLTPTPHHRCYERLATPFHGKPYRDFYYAVTYEALRILVESACASIAIAGITGANSKLSEPDVGNCVAEAIAHCALAHPSLERIFITKNGPDVSYGIAHFKDHPNSLGKHRQIGSRSTTEENGNLICVVELGH